MENKDNSKIEFNKKWLWIFIVVMVLIIVVLIVIFSLDFGGNGGCSSEHCGLNYIRNLL